MLTYLLHGLNTATVTNIHKVAVDTFSWPETKEAATLLWSAADLGKPPVKRSQTDSGKCAALMTDIINAIQKLDDTNKLPYFVIDAIGLSRLPKFGIEEANEIALTARVRKLELKLLRVDDIIAEHAEAIVNARPNKEKSTLKPSTDINDTTDIDRPTTTTTIQSDTADKEQQIRNIAKSFASMAVQLDRNDEWKVKENKKRRRQQSTVMGHGKLTNSRIKAAPPPDRSYYITGFSKDTTTDDIEAHLTESGINPKEVTCALEKDRYKAFKVSVNITHG